MLYFLEFIYIKYKYYYIIVLREYNHIETKYNIFTNITNNYL